MQPVLFETGNLLLLRQKDLIFPENILFD